MQRVFSFNLKSPSSVRTSCCAMFSSFSPRPSNSATNNTPSQLSLFVVEFLMNCYIHLIILNILEFQEKCHRYHLSSKIVLRKEGRNNNLFLLQDFFIIKLDLGFRQISFTLFQPRWSLPPSGAKQDRARTTPGGQVWQRSQRIRLHPSFKVRLRPSSHRTW